jgi:glutamine synthetase
MASACFAATVDLNGVWRGKRLPASQIAKIDKGGLRMPSSVSAVDIWGEDLVDGDFMLATGDGDGICVPTGRTPVQMSWVGGSPLMIPVCLMEEDGQSSQLDPRHALARVVDAFTERGMTVVVATELEFYLYGLQADVPTPPVDQSLFKGDNVLSLDELELIDGLLNDLYIACDAAGIPADSAISETGPGQFEVNFMHAPDPLKAAEDALIFKKMLKGIARRHNFGASFMAKPYGNRSGNGMHVHFSIIDQNGNNLFDDGTERGSDLLLHAVQGLLETMRDYTLIWAPHANSYRRLTPGAHAPTAVSWGYENRTVAVRIPGGSAQARRIEHRVSGADANPYLVLAAILGGALHGMNSSKLPPKPVTGNAYDQSLPQLVPDWTSAVSVLKDSKFDLLPSAMVTALQQMKLQEISRFQSDISAFEYQTYLGTV